MKQLAGHGPLRLWIQWIAAAALTCGCCGCGVLDPLNDCWLDVECVDGFVFAPELNPALFFDCDRCADICQPDQSRAQPRMVVRTAAGQNTPQADYPPPPPPCETRPMDDDCVLENGDPAECPQRLADDPCDEYCIRVCKYNPEICFHCDRYPNLCRDEQ